MLRKPPLALLLISALFSGAHGAEAPRSTKTLSAGATKTDGVITLQRADGVYRAAGLWSERHDFPKTARVTAVRLLNAKIPRVRCDIFTQVRWTDAAGRPSEWTPANFLMNGDFADGPPRGCKLMSGRGAEPARYATAPITRPVRPLPMWRAVAAPGASLSFAASVFSKAALRRVGVSSAFTDRAGKEVVRAIMLTGQEPGKSVWRRVSVGTTVPADARVFKGAAEHSTPATRPKRNDTIAAGEAVLAFTGPSARKPFFTADFSKQSEWAPRKPQLSFSGGKHPALTLVVDAEHNPATAFIEKLVPFKHRGWIEIRATVTVKKSLASVVLLFFRPETEMVVHHVSLQCIGQDGTYRVWGRGPVPKEAGALRLMVMGALNNARRAEATYRSIELVACDPPPKFTRRPPVDRITLPKAVDAKTLEVRSFLLSGSPKLSPSFEGYAIEQE